MIYFDKDIGEYYHKTFNQMYYDLLDIKREYYNNDDKIIVKCFSNTDVGIWKHFLNIVKFLDIPTFFIQIKTSDPKIKNTIAKLVNEILPLEHPIEVELVNTREYSTSNTLCVHPFSSIYITAEGKYKICCKWDDVLDTHNITNTSLKQAQSSEKFSNVRKEMLQSKKPIACNSCWIDENFSGASMRTSTNQIFPELTYGTDYTKDSQDIQTLDLHLGNVCNLKCRICGPSNSSSWIKELKQKNAIIQPNWISDTSSQIWQHLKTNLSTLKYITFHGGEPFLDRNHYTIIDYLISENRTDIKLHYNTNGTVYPKILLDKLLNFQKVTLSFSIDNIGKKFEYERHGKSWDIVLRNLQKFSQLDRQKFKLEFHSTVNIFNILDLEDLVKLCNDLNYHPYFNMLTSPAYYSVLNIPIEKRKKIIDKLKDSKNNHVRSFSLYLEQQKQLNLLDDFWNHTMSKDIIRNENFSITFPELSELLGD